MASFKLDLPTDVIKHIEKINKNSDKIFGGMTKAGADITLATVRANAPQRWRNSQIMRNIGVTRTYKTPTDGGINNKVIIEGYFTNKNGVKTPAPLVANVFEYGSSKFSKQPFFRRSFRPSQIEREMLRAQKELSGGLLE